MRKSLSPGRDRFAEIAARFPRLRIVVLGDIMLDRYLSGPADRISPEAPVPVVRVAREWEAPGGAANVAANVLSLGARCDVVGVGNEDGPGRAVRQILLNRGAVCHMEPARDRGTTVKTRILARGQQVVRIDREETAPVPAPVRAALESRLLKVLPGADALIVADYDKGALSPELIGFAIRAARERGLPVFADPKARHFFGFGGSGRGRADSGGTGHGGATLFKPNRAEIEAALGEEARPADPLWMEAARRRTGAEHLLLTLGADGMALASPGGAVRRFRVAARSVYDVSGAGDTVIAAVAAAWAAGARPDEAVTIAAHAAAIGVGRVGVATVTPSEIAARLAGQ